MSEDDFEKYVHNNLEIARDLDNRYSLNTLEDMKIEFESSPYFVEVDGKCIVNEWSIYGMCIAHSALKVGYYRVMSKDGDDTISNVDNNLKIFSDVSSYSIPHIPITDIPCVAASSIFLFIAAKAATTAVAVHPIPVTFAIIGLPFFTVSTVIPSVI